MSDEMTSNLVLGSHSKNNNNNCSRSVLRHSLPRFILEADMSFPSMHLYLCTLSTLLLLANGESSGLLVSPDIVAKNCTIGQLCTGFVDSSTVHYYTIDYTFDPMTGIRVTTHMEYKMEQDAPILVVVRQVRGVLSWTLPYVFSNGMIYSSVARILCLYNELNRTHPHTSTMFIEVSTSNPKPINYSLQLDNVTEYIIQTDAERSISISPTMPTYFKYTFPPDVDNVFIEVQSKDNLCTVVSVQSFDCPVYDVSEIGVRQGHYQTMSSQASFNVYASDFSKRNEFLLVFIVKSTDVDCLDYQKQAAIIPAGLIDIPRQKQATVNLRQPTYYKFLYLTIFATVGVFLLVYLVSFIIMCKQQDAYDLLVMQHFNPLEVPVENEMAVCRPASNQTITADGEESVGGSRARNSFVRTPSMGDMITTSATGFVTVNNLCEKDYADLQQKFRIYPQTMMTIAVFYSLPVIQLVLQYQFNIESSGNEDLCYFNFLCTRQLAMLTAFNNIFSNLGYCLLGILFLIIVLRRDKAYARYIEKHQATEKGYGIPQHFGLFYAMAIGLFMEGIMSACYHVCPSKQNFQFDTSFMFIIAVLNIIKIYQARHPDINPRSSGAFAFLAFIILINVVGVYYDQQWFWITYCIAHILLCFAFTGKIYYMGRVKVSYNIHIHLYKLVGEGGFLSRPRYLNRMIILFCGNILNIAFAIYGVSFQPESFPNHLLFVLLGNLALYLMYYIVMKIIHREHFTRYAVIFLLSALMFWGVSLYFFYQEVKSYEVQPAISRQRNKPCVVLQTYDVHDVWHILSSFGLFFSFMGILTMDDGIRTRERKELAAF